jgi:replicative DNA helicase
MGKTALALRVAIETAKRRRAAVFISLEMPTSPEMVARVASLETGEKNAVIDSANPDREAFNAVALAQSRIGKIPLVFRDKPGATPGQVRAIARKVFARYRQQGIEPGVIIVDYLQLMRSQAERGATRERQVASCSMALKEIAKELGCAVVVLSQLSRTVDDRSNNDHRPQLSDLRESGAIEQDADVVMFPFRPSRYDKSLEADTEEAEIIFAKFRGGCEGIVNVCWRGECMAYLGRECDQTLDDLNDSFDERYG